MAGRPDLLQCGKLDPTRVTKKTTAELRTLVLAHPERALGVGEYMKRHTLLLHVVFTRDGKPCQTHFSGMLFQREGILYWVTAAHCIDEIRKSEVDPSIRIETARWIDHDTRPAARGIPVDVREMLAIHVPSEMLDIAAVPLLGNTADLLRRSNTFAPLTEQVWNRNPEQVPGLLAIGGYPGEWFKGMVTEGRNTYEVTFLANHAFLPVDPVDAPPDPLPGTSEWWSRSDCIYGSVLLPADPPRLRLESIVGMSGGPAFSLEWDESHDTIRYRLYGIQSEWLPQSHFVRIERIENVPALISAYTEVAFGKSGTSDRGGSSSEQ